MKDKTQNQNIDYEAKRVEFKKLVEMCGAFK